MRIQFDIDPDYWDRLRPYINNPKTRHEITRQALEEWLTRREARDKRARFETLRRDKELLAPIVKELLADMRES